MLITFYNHLDYIIKLKNTATGDIISLRNKSTNTYHGGDYVITTPTKKYILPELPTKHDLKIHFSDKKIILEPWSMCISLADKTVNHNLPNSIYIVEYSPFGMIILLLIFIITVIITFGGVIIFKYFYKLPK